MAQTYSDLRQNIQDKFNEAGLEIIQVKMRQSSGGQRDTAHSD